MKALDEHAIRLSQAGEPYEPAAEKLPPWKAAAFWASAIFVCVGVLYVAGYCLHMAWKAWPA
ncbi:hypothetical protein NL532_24240 [Mesorhizobium sp. C120A]|uniref:hypothetical protein n=1 Tax=unclassified Mesorhizobium TaxID=325217 RepID=UPI0003D06948|nr:MULTISPECIES: hypothetical protein [unclassified Mesorhizobium]ESZ60675.1 hypothetical protein X728_15190 [Mesorhizobium sp. L103C120A0]WJI43720.1 hypothetical protein NL532_24240 [Mesorhizobium sp. C120A]